MTRVSMIEVGVKLERVGDRHSTVPFLTSVFAAYASKYLVRTEDLVPADFVRETIKIFFLWHQEVQQHGIDLGSIGALGVLKSFVDVLNMVLPEPVALPVQEEFGAFFRFAAPLLQRRERFLPGACATPIPAKEENKF